MLARDEGGPERVVTQGLSVPEPVVAMLREHAAFLQEQGQPGLPTCWQAALLLCGNHLGRPVAFTVQSKSAALAGTTLQMQSGSMMLRAAAWPSGCNMCTAEQYLL